MSPFRRASTRASSSTRAPRPTFTTCADGFIACNTSALRMPRVSSVKGAIITMWSAQPAWAAKSALETTSLKSASWLRTVRPAPRTFRPTAFRSLAVARPMPPVPTTRAFCPAVRWTSRCFHTVCC
ncbi:hypothetical protein D9M72_600150 [compost metagenome]